MTTNPIREYVDLIKTALDYLYLCVEKTQANPRPDSEEMLAYHLMPNAGPGVYFMRTKRMDLVQQWDLHYAPLIARARVAVLDHAAARGSIAVVFDIIRRINTAIPEAVDAAETARRPRSFEKTYLQPIYDCVNDLELLAPGDGLAGPDDFRGTEAQIVQALRQHGKRMTTPTLLNKALGTSNNGYAKSVLSGLVKRGVLTNKTDERGKGYGLAEWG